jgi:hypothetical protein
MKRVISLAVVVFLFTSLCSAVRPGLIPGKLVSAMQTSDGPQVVYRLHILVGNQFYVVEQRPTFFLNVYMPHEFFLNGPVQVRITDRYLYLMRPTGKEMRMSIVMKRIIEDHDELAALNRQADKPVPSDTVAAMLDEAAEKQRGRLGPLIPGGVPHSD